MSRNANVLLTEDNDLLALDPFGDARILTRSAYLQENIFFEEVQPKSFVKLIN